MRQLLQNQIINMKNLGPHINYVGFGSPKSVPINYIHHNNPQIIVSNQHKILQPQIHQVIHTSPPPIQSNQIRNVVWNITQQRNQRVISNQQHNQAQYTQLKSKYEDLMNEYKKKQNQVNGLQLAYHQLQIQKDQYVKYIQSYQQNEAKKLKNSGTQKQFKNSKRTPSGNQSNKNISNNQNTQSINSEQKQNYEKQIIQIQQIAEQRQKQLKAKFQQYLRHLQQQNHQLIEMNKQYQNSMKNLMEELDRPNSERQNLQYQKQIQKLTLLLKNKDKQTNGLLMKIAKLESDLVQSKNDIEAELQIKNYKKRIEILQSEIQRCNSTILNKNKQIFELKSLNFESDKLNKLSLQLKSSLFQIQRLNQIVQQKNNQIINLKNNFAESERKVMNYDQQYKQLLMNRDDKELETVKQVVNKKQFQINKFKQALNLKQNHINQLQTQKQQSRNKLIELQNLLEKQKEQSRYKISQLQFKINDYDKKFKFFETERQQLMRLSNDNSKNASKAIQNQKNDQIKHLENQLKQYGQVIKTQREQAEQAMNYYQQKVNHYQNLLHQFQKKNQQNIRVLEIKDQQIKQLQNQATILKNSIQINKFTQSINSLKEQIEKKNLDIQNKRIQYETNLRNYRSEYQKSYTESLKILEQKILDLETQLSSKEKIIQQLQCKNKQLLRQKQSRQLASKQKIQVQDNNLINNQSFEINKKLKRDNQKLKKLLKQSNSKLESYEGMSQNIYQLQYKVKQFQQRIMRFITQSNTKGSPNFKNGTNNIKVMMSDLDAKLIKFKTQNQKLKAKLIKSKELQDKIKEIEEQNQKLIDDFNHYEEKIQRSGSEIMRLKQIIYEYETLLQNNSKMNFNDISLEKIKYLEQKVNFFKSKNSQLQSRVSQLIEINAVLKSQFDKKSNGKNINNSFSPSHKTDQTTLIQKYEAEIKILNDQINILKKTKETRLSSNSMNKNIQIQGSLFDLNMKINNLNNQKLNLETHINQLNLLNQQQQFTIRDLQKKLQLHAQQQNINLQNKIKISELQSVNFDQNLKVTSLSSQITFFQTENANYKNQLNQLQQKFYDLNFKLQNSYQQKSIKESEYHQQRLRRSELEAMKNQKQFEINQQKSKNSQLQIAIIELNNKLSALVYQKQMIESQRQQQIAKTQQIFNSNQQMEKYIKDCQIEIQNRENNRFTLIQKIIVLSQEIQRLHTKVGDESMQIKDNSGSNNLEKQQLKQTIVIYEEKMNNLIEELNYLKEIANQQHTIIQQIDAINYYLQHFKTNLENLQVLFSQLKLRNSSQVQISSKIYDHLSRIHDIFNQLQAIRRFISEKQQQLSK